MKTVNALQSAKNALRISQNDLKSAIKEGNDEAIAYHQTNITYIQSKIDTEQQAQKASDKKQAKTKAATVSKAKKAAQAKTEAKLPAKTSQEDKRFLTDKKAANAILKAAKMQTLQGQCELLAPMVYHALVHGNVAITAMNNLRLINDSRVKPFKTLIGKHLPITWNKEKKTFVFSKAKRENQLKDFGQYCKDFDSLVDALVKANTPKPSKVETLTDEQQAVKDMEKLTNYIVKNDNLTAAHKYEAILQAVNISDLKAAIEAKEAAAVGMADDSNPAF